MDLETICNWMNDQSVIRPDLITALLRTQHCLEELEVPDDLLVYTSNTTILTTDFLCIINSIFASTGKQIVSVNVENSYQFIVVNIHEEVRPA